MQFDFNSGATEIKYFSVNTQITEWGVYKRNTGMNVL